MQKKEGAILLESREIIAKKIAEELHDGDVVNLGVGIPTLVAKIY